MVMKPLQSEYQNQFSLMLGDKWRQYRLAFVYIPHSKIKLTNNMIGAKLFYFAMLIKTNGKI